MLSDRKLVPGGEGSVRPPTDAENDTIASIFGLNENRRRGHSLLQINRWRSKTLTKAGTTLDRRTNPAAIHTEPFDQAGPASALKMQLSMQLSLLAARPIFNRLGLTV